MRSWHRGAVEGGGVLGGEGRNVASIAIMTDGLPPFGSFKTSVDVYNTTLTAAERG